MKLTCSKDLLLHYINIVNKAVSSRTTLPILECILLHAETDRFTMTANNLELGIQTAPIDATIIQTGEIAIEAKIFHEIIRRLNGETVTLETGENNAITITGGTSRFTIMGQAGDDFPSLPQVAQEEAYTLGQNELRNLIRQTIFSISQESTKQILTGELFEMKEHCMHVVSIDGYRISFRKSPLEHEFAPKSVVVPGKTLTELMKILSQEEEDKVQLYFTEKHVLFDLGIATMVSRLLEGDYVSYENNFTEDYKTKLIIHTAELIQALERASLVSRDNRKTPVRLELRPNVLVITARSDMGTAYEEVPNETDGDEMQIAFNPRYLIEALRAIEDEKVAIRFTGSLSPCTIVPLEGNAYQYLILPLRM
ncbi:MAG TPA: DNA polymerase III subunit beta [Candidatus Anaerotignum merdipullorum]|nr:DNA polymerase III subunit beta [Candidatus Anaerotignum merdipullorum]